MTEALPQLPFPVAYQHFSDYLTCPKRFNHRYVAKDSPKEVKSRQQSGGINVHDAFKKRLKLREPLPPEFADYEPMCRDLDADTTSHKEVELALGCTRNGQPTSFFDDNVALRGRIDLVLVRSPLAVIIDWKTGKPWDDPLELKIQALLLRIHKPELDKVQAFYQWLRTGKSGTVYRGKEMDPAAIWESVHRMMTSMAFRISTQDWPADENPLCAWCPVSKAQCQFRKDPPQR